MREGAMPSARAVGLALGFAALLALVGLGAVAHQRWVAPLTQLPRPEAEIEADWARLRLPRAVAPAAWDPALAEVLVALRHDESAPPVPDAALEPVLAWLDRGDPLPSLSCVALAEGPVDLMRLYDVGRVLLRSGHPEHAAELGAQLRAHELLGLVVGTALINDASPNIDDPSPWSPASEHLVEALRWEAACVDAVFDTTFHGLQRGPVEALFLDLHVERLRVRDAYARLLLDLQPVRHDPAAMIQRFQALAALPPDPASPVASLTLSIVPKLAIEYLEALPKAAP